MKEIAFQISGLHAYTLATHLIIVLKNYITGKKEGSIPPEKMDLLTHLDGAYQKLNALTENRDDETPRQIRFTLPEAEALIQAFIADDFKMAALQDPFYQQHVYADYFRQVYARYLKEIGAEYILALAA